MKLKSIQFFDGYTSEVIPSSTIVNPVKNTLDAVVAPEATNDETEGYIVGSLWFDTITNNLYICEDVTEDNAVWTLVNVNRVSQTIIDGNTNTSPSEDAVNDALDTLETSINLALDTKQDINTDPFRFELFGEIRNPVLESFNSPVYVESARTLSSAVLIIQDAQVGSFNLQIRSTDNSGGDEVIHVDDTVVVSSTGLQKQVLTIDTAPLDSDRFLMLYVSHVSGNESSNISLSVK